MGTLILSSKKNIWESEQLKKHHHTLKEQKKTQEERKNCKCKYMYDVKNNYYEAVA